MVVKLTFYQVLWVTLSFTAALIFLMKSSMAMTYQFNVQFYVHYSAMIEHHSSIQVLCVVTN